MVKHERLYTSLLVIFAVAILCSMAVVALFMALPAEARPVQHWPDWLHYVSAFLSGVYFCAVVTTLLLRRAERATSHRATRALNVALLFAPPFGTAIGVYGLWRVE
jgi:hypothetical protein